MHKALSIVGAGLIVTAAGVALYSPAAAVIFLGLAICTAGLILVNFKGPQA